mmetsp:Transcript_101497/g.316482  ORF Transcript_101497/g.316482 Transcript_101497/m.316482 type:complete len:368 (+) Transcript_101497:128-1231(+)
MFGQCYEVSNPCMPVRRNGSWWGFWIIGTMVEEVTCKGDDHERVRYWKQNIHGIERWIKTTLLELTGPPDRLVGGYLYQPLTAFTEVRQFWSRLPAGLVNTYHSFTVIDTAGDFSLLLEKKTSQLEFMFGAGPLARNFMMEFRALATPRNVRRCSEQPKRALPGNITVCRLLEWMDGPLAKCWEPYSLFDANCQHFTRRVQDFLCDPAAAEAEWWRTTPRENFEAWRLGAQDDPSILCVAPEHLLSSRVFVLAVVSGNGQALRFVPRNFRRDWRVVCTAVAEDGLALEHAADEFRADREVALLAVGRNGLALEHCAPALLQDKQIVHAAVQQNSAALRYADRSLQHDRDVLMTAGRKNPLALRFAVV